MVFENTEKRMTKKPRETLGYYHPIMYFVRVLDGATTTLGKVNRNKRDVVHMYSYNLHYPLSRKKKDSSGISNA